MLQKNQELIYLIHVVLLLVVVVLVVLVVVLLLIWCWCLAECGVCVRVGKI